MKTAWMVCSLCAGAGMITPARPNWSADPRIPCPQCLGEHIIDTRSCLAVIVPDDSPLPNLDSKQESK